MRAISRTRARISKRTSDVEEQTTARRTRNAHGAGSRGGSAAACRPTIDSRNRRLRRAPGPDYELAKRVAAGWAEETELGRTRLADGRNCVSIRASRPCPAEATRR